LYDGTYTLGDLLDYHEIMTVSAENQKRMEAASKAAAELERG